MTLGDLEVGKCGRVDYGGFGDGGVRTYVYIRTDDGFLRLYSSHLRDGKFVFNLIHKPGIPATPNLLTPCKPADDFFVHTCPH